MSHLLDTNALINYLDGSIPKPGMNLLNSILDIEPIISIITKMEALGYEFRSFEEQTTMETFVNSTFVIDLNDDIVTKTIEIRRSQKMKLPDAIIAATALVNDLTLITRNTADFKNIPELRTIDPHKV